MVKRRLLSFVLAIVMLCTMLPHVQIEVDAVTGVYTWIKDRSAVDGSDYTTSSELAQKLNQIFDGNASVYFDKSCTNLVNTQIGTSNVKNDGVTKYVGPYGKAAINSGTSCWIYANGVYYTLFGECTGNGTAGSNSERLNIGSTSSTTASYNNFKSWGVRQGVGALIRADGHSMIVLGYDEDYLTILDGNGNSNGLVSIRVRSWDQVSFSVSYIIQPKETYFNSTYPEHKYSNVGVCSECGAEFNWQATFDASCAGVYKVTLSGGIYLRTDKPYSASTNKSALIKAGTQVQVLGRVTNHYKTDNKWYKVSYNGVVGYTNANNLTLSGYGAQVISCTLSSPAEGATVPKAAYPVIGTVTSKYPLQEVVAYIDGTKYATVTLGSATTLNIRSSDINQKLSFSRLSSGSHTLVIKARDIHHSDLITVCTRKFITEGAVTCSHSYTGKVTTSSTCLVDGVKTYTCSKCGDSYTEAIPATGYHSWGAWGVTRKATCTSAGSKQRRCAVCRELETKTISATGHSYGSWTTTKSATCTTAGTQQKKCTKCSATQTQSIAAKGHSYGSWVTTTAAGCTSTGTQKKTCSSCGNVQTQSVAATGHNYVGKVTAAESCGDNGTKTYTCSGCGSSYTETIPATGKHSWGEWKHLFTDMDGNRIWVSFCQNCSASRYCDHSYGVWNVRQEVSCTTDGLEYRCCYECNNEETRVIPMTDHNYVSGKCASCGKYDPDRNTSGDLTGDEKVTNDDVVYLLWYTLFPESYPVDAEADYTNDGRVNNEDVVYLLWYALFPEKYPLQ